METILQVFLTLAFCQGVLLIIPPIVIKTTNDFWLRGATARNNPLFIWIDPHQVYYEAVLAQEVYECEERKWLYNLAKWYVSSDYKREVELMGQAIEIVIATKDMHRVAAKKYLQKQAATLSGKYSQFNKTEIEAIEDMLYKSLPKAEMWVKENVK